MLMRSFESASGTNIDGQCFCGGMLDDGVQYREIKGVSRTNRRRVAGSSALEPTRR
jgi:hypothetical protein